jgi:DNA-directed RNA polymerase subunit RPC12/RpoP
MERDSFSSYAEGIMIRYLCPRCQKPLTAQDGEAGAKVNCSSCGQKVQVPLPPASKTMLGTLDAAAPIPAVPRALLVEKEPLPDSQEPLLVEAVDEPRRRDRARGDEVDDRPRRRSRDDYDDDDDYDLPRRRRRSRIACPRCGCRDYPRQTTKLGGASIALLIIGILFWPLIIVALLLQEKWEVCSNCGEQLRQTGTGF